MNKYLKGFINAPLKLAVGFVGGLTALNILAASFIFYPEIMLKVDQVLIGTLASYRVLYFVVSYLPLIFVCIFLALSTATMFGTIWLMKRIDIVVLRDFVVPKRENSKK